MGRIEEVIEAKTCKITDNIRNRNIAIVAMKGITHPRGGRLGIGKTAVK